MTNRKVLCVVDPNLRDRLGHHFEYDYSLLEPVLRRGYEFLVLGHRQVEKAIASAMPVEGVFPHDIWERFPGLARIPGGVGHKLDILLSNLRFFRVLCSRLPSRTVTADWVVFGHMITLHQLLGWAWWFRSLSPRNLPRLVLLFRYSAEWFANSRFAAHAFRLLEGAHAPDRVCLGSDSERLAREYARFTRLPFQVFPIPHTTHQVGPGEFASQSLARRPMCLVSVGNARDEKGFLEILQAIVQLHNSGQLQRFKFILQSNDLYAPNTATEILSTIAEIKKLKLDNVRFIDEVLSTEAYYGLLREADVVLLPYWRSIYASRTSGIFVEALAAGRTVIVTEDTWMSDQLRDYGSGAVCRDHDPHDLVRAVLNIEARFPEYSERARLTRDAWLERHNPEALIEGLLEPRRKLRKPERVAVLYPWGDILERQGGASRRVGLVIDLLKERYDQIRVLAPGHWSDVQVENVQYLSYRPSRLEAAFSRGARRVFELLLRVITLGKSKNEDYMLWQHCWWIFEPTLVRRIHEVVRWADVVFLEYTFWARPVENACRRARTKFILTNYDVVSHQVARSALLRRLTLRAEAGGLRRADHAVCVSTGDQETFKSCGVDAEVIPHAIDTARYRSRWSDDFTREILSKLHRIRVPRKNVCLFVGSLFLANVEAVQSIRRIAESLSGSVMGDSVNFVVVGGCAPPEKNGNFVTLGKVKAEVLHALYQLADLVLVPLPRGTGASVKTLEAMAYGKAILGTRVGFRGYPVESDVQCLVSDDLVEYPKLITDLLGDCDRRQRLGRNALRFADAYDYRKVYQRYISLTEGS